jgi:hypothetical protein
MVQIYGPSLDHCFYSLDSQEMSLVKFRPSYHEDVTRLDQSSMSLNRAVPSTTLNGLEPLPRPTGVRCCL